MPMISPAAPYSEPYLMMLEKRKHINGKATISDSMIEFFVLLFRILDLSSKWYNNDMGMLNGRKTATTISEGRTSDETLETTY